MKISALMPILNGIKNGYPFLKAILFILPIVDEFLIEDGKSQDQTLKVLKKLKEKFPQKIFIFEKKWSRGDCWKPIDRAVEFLISKAKGDWIFEVQGDEIWHENDILKLKKAIEYANEHFFNSIRQSRIDIKSGWKKQEYVYRTVRIVRKIKNLKSYFSNSNLEFLPAIAKGLVGKKKYEIRKKLFDKKYLQKITKINYEKI